MPPDHSHSGPSTPRGSTSSDEDDIEMTSMHEIAITPRSNGAAANGGFKHVHHASPDDSDDESDRDEETGRALLGGMREGKDEEEAHGVETPTIWRQVRRLVIEVRHICRVPDGFFDT